MELAKKLKPYGPIFKRFEFWTKMAKVTKPQGPFWQFSLSSINLLWSISSCYLESTRR
ncbi:hypothetical protein Hanom_Chr11g00998521 [Helianthus anomalus]